MSEGLYPLGMNIRGPQEFELHFRGALPWFIALMAIFVCCSPLGPARFGTARLTPGGASASQTKVIIFNVEGMT